MIIDMLNNGMDSLKRGFSSYLKYEEIVKENPIFQSRYFRPIVQSPIMNPCT